MRGIFAVSMELSGRAAEGSGPGCRWLSPQVRMLNVAVGFE